MNTAKKNGELDDQVKEQSRKALGRGNKMKHKKIKSCGEQKKKCQYQYYWSHCKINGGKLVF